MRLQSVILHHLLDRGSNVLPVVLTVQTFTHDDPHLAPTLSLHLPHRSFGSLESLTSVQSVQIHGARRTVFVVGHENPICCLFVEPLHVGFVIVAFIGELLGAVPIALGVGFVGLVEAACHLVTFGSGLVAEAHVVGIVLVDLVVLGEFVVGTLGGCAVVRLGSRIGALRGRMIVAADSCSSIPSSTTSKSTTKAALLRRSMRSLLCIRTLLTAISSTAVSSTARGFTSLVFLVEAKRLFGKIDDLALVLLDETDEFVHLALLFTSSGWEVG